MTIGDPTSARPSWRRWLAVLTVLGSIVLVVIIGGYFYLSADEAPKDDSILRVSIPSVPDAQNGYLQMDPAARKRLSIWEYAQSRAVDLKTVDYSEGLPKDTAVLDAFLVQAQGDFAQFDKCLTQPYFQFPGLIEMNKSLAVDPSLFANLEDALDLSARESLARRDYTATMRDLTRLHQLGVRLLGGYPTVTDVVVAAGADSRANEVSMKILAQPDLPVVIQQQLAAINAIDIPWQAAAKNALVQEYAERTQNVSDMHEWRIAHIQGGFLSATWWRVAEHYECQQNKSRNRILELCLAVKRGLDGPYAEIDPSVRNYHYEGESSLRGENFDRIRHPNYIGKIEISDANGSLFEMARSVYSQIAEDRLIRVGLALHRYYDEHHQLPPKLTESAPQYLSAIPKDPFDGQALRYDAERGVVYSVGTSLQDTGGSDDLKTDKTNLDKEREIGDVREPTFIILFQQPGK